MSRQTKLDLDEISRAQVGPRELKSPTSREYAIQTIQHLRRLLEMLKYDEEKIKSELEEIDKYEHWKILGYSSCDAMLEEELKDVSPERKARLRQTLLQRARKEAVIKPGPKPAEMRDNITELDDGRGTAPPYILRRLVRAKREDLIAKFERGELTANAAAIAAGFRIRTITVPLEPVRAVATIKRHFTPAQCQAIAAGLVASVATVATP